MWHTLSQASQIKAILLSRRCRPLDSLTKMQTVEIKLNSFLLKQTLLSTVSFCLDVCVCVCEPKRTCQMINHFVSAFNTFPSPLRSLLPRIVSPTLPCLPPARLSCLDFSSLSLCLPAFFFFCLNAKSSSIMWHASVFSERERETLQLHRGAKGRAFLFPFVMLSL